MWPAEDPEDWLVIQLSCSGGVSKQSQWNQVLAGRLAHASQSQLGLGQLGTTGATSKLFPY